MSTASTSHSSKLLQSKLASVRSKQLFVALGTGVAWLILASVGLLALGMFIDWHIALSRDARMLLLVVDAIVLFSIFKQHIYTPFTNQPNDEEVALNVEKATPEFRTRLIASTQFGQSKTIEDTGAAFVHALVNETEDMARPRNFNAVVPIHGFARALCLGLLAVGLGAVAYNEDPKKIGDLFKRAFLSSVPVPRDTHIESIIAYSLHDPASKPRDVFARQDNIQIKVTIKGSSREKHPDVAKINIKYASGKSAKDDKVKNIAAPDASGIYLLKLENVGESFTVIASANDSFSITKKVEVVPRPAVSGIKFVQEYPPYTGVKPVVRNPGDLTLLTGSNLRIEVNATKPVARWQLKTFHNNGKVREMDINGTSNTMLSATLLGRGVTDPPLQDSNVTVSVILWDENGFKSWNETKYRIEISPDERPVVRLLSPNKASKVTTRARLPIRVSVRDDFGVDKVQLMITHGNSPPLPPKILPLKQGQAIIDYEWDIGENKPPVGAELKYRVEAFDTAPNPGRGESRKLIALVVSDQEKRDELVNRATDSLTGVNESASKEEKLNLELGMIISRPREKYITARVDNIGNKIRSEWFAENEEVKWKILGFHHQANLTFVETNCTPSVGSSQVVWVLLFPDEGPLIGDPIGVYLKKESKYTLHKTKMPEEIKEVESLSRTLPSRIKQTFERPAATSVEEDK